MRQMKDSGIEWIGEIPDDWEVGKLKNFLISYYSGGTPDSSKEEFYDDNGIPWVVIADMTDNEYVYDTYKHIAKNAVLVKHLSVLPVGTILYAMYASVGKVSELAVEATINQAILGLQIDSFKVEKQFVKLFLQSWEPYIKAETNGTTQFNLNANKVLNIAFVCPSIDEQQKIADFLDDKSVKINNLISHEQATIEELKAYKQSVITEAVTKGLDKNVPMKDSGVEWIGQIPDSWNFIGINKAFSFLGGFPFQSEKFCGESNYQVVRIGNVKNFKLNLEASPAYITDEYAQAAIKYQIQQDDLLFTMTGTKGKGDYFYSCLVQDSDLHNKNLFINQRVGCFRRLDKRVYMNYYNYLLKIDSIRNYVFLYETGTANQGNIGIEALSRIKLILPNYQEQQQIADYLDKKCFDIDSLISIKQQKIEELKEYKKSLIYEYVTGKKEVA